MVKIIQQELFSNPAGKKRKDFTLLNKQTRIWVPVLYTCSRGQETIEHALLHCQKYDTERSQLIKKLGDMEVKVDVKVIRPYFGF